MIENVDVAIEKISGCGDLKEMVDAVKADRVVSALISTGLFIVFLFPPGKKRSKW